jgi:hypothetical protein
MHHEQHPKAGYGALTDLREHKTALALTHDATGSKAASF